VWLSRKSKLRSRVFLQFPNFFLEKVHRPRFDSPVHFDKRKKREEKGDLCLSFLLSLVWKTKPITGRDGKIKYQRFDRRNPPPPGGGFYLVGSLTKNPEEEDPPRRICTRCFEGGPLPPGSWFGNLPNRKPPRGGGFLRSIALCFLTQ